MHVTEAFFDSSFIRVNKGLDHLHLPPKFEKEVLSNTEPYEGKENGYYSIIKIDSGEDPLYRMYYRSKSSHSYTTVAESKNGIDFDKPELELIPYKGDTGNNILLQDGSVVHNFYPTQYNDHYFAIGGSVSTKYKGINGIYLLHSEDGLEWTKGDKLFDTSNVIPQTTIGSYFDSLNTLQWCEHNNEWIVWIRYNPDVGIRSVQYATSKDLVNFTETKEIVVKNQEFSHEFSIYALNAMIYPDSPYFIAFPLMQIGNEKDSKYVSIMYSRDGKYWSVIKDLIQCNLDAPFNAVCGLVRSVYGKKMYLYLQDMTTHKISCWSYRYHGFNKLITYETGYITTKVIGLETADVWINIKTHGKFSYVQVVLYDERHRILAESTKCTGNMINLKVQWDHDVDIAIGKRCYFKITLHHSSLFSIVYDQHM